MNQHSSRSPSHLRSELGEHANEWNNLAVEELTPSHAEVITRLKRHLPKSNVPQRGDEPEK
jgi:hypothetical protein